MLIRNATLPDGRTGIDLLVQQGRIAAVGPQLQAPPDVETIDAGRGAERVVDDDRDRRRSVPRAQPPRDRARRGRDDRQEGEHAQQH